MRPSKPQAGEQISPLVPGGLLSCTLSIYPSSSQCFPGVHVHKPCGSLHKTYLFATLQTWLSACHRPGLTKLSHLCCSWPPTPHTCLQLHQVLLIKEGKEVINLLFLVKTVPNSSSSSCICTSQKTSSHLCSASLVVSADAWLGDGTCLSFLS